MHRKTTVPILSNAFPINTMQLRVPVQPDEGDVVLEGVGAVVALVRDDLVDGEVLDGRRAVGLGVLAAGGVAVRLGAQGVLARADANAA